MTDASERERLAEALDRLQAASENASAGPAYTCGPPWFRHGDGVLIGSPDPHAGRLIADTDTSGFDDDHDGTDDEPNAIFIAEAWNFARLILSNPKLLAALRSGQGAGAGRVEGDERRWRRTGKGAGGLGADGGTAEWFRPSDGMIADYPLYFDPNVGGYVGFRLQPGAEGKSPARRETPAPPPPTTAESTEGRDHG